ncbi:ADP-ribosylglycohydrolase family protein [Saccharopolyspora erythraea]|uniref:type VII secretion system-associated protein n=1 Tax=Saccharopolyspora erythraea TaxID=1836 RepID=UPI001BAAD452|nr:type VII secretion system-associated protein [Saccharopolyspora erythraea]QUH05202.1 ADP-ribosylglycohydrolase family protein [Saccharopolyspora erythraea]
MTDRPPIHAITPEMRAAAKQTPDSWHYVIDPFFDPNGEVPAWGIAGWYRIGPDGEFDENFQPNPQYRPSPVAMGFRAPRTELEMLVQLTATGYGSEDRLAEKLVEGTVLAAADEKGTGVAVVDRGDGPANVIVYSSPHLVPETAKTVELSGRTLATMSAQVEIVLDPSSPVSVRLPLGALQSWGDRAANRDPDGAAPDTAGSDAPWGTFPLAFLFGLVHGGSAGVAAGAVATSEPSQDVSEPTVFRRAVHWRTRSGIDPFVEQTVRGIELLISLSTARRQGVELELQEVRLPTDDSTLPRLDWAVSFCAGLAMSPETHSAGEKLELVLAMSRQWDLDEEARVTAAAHTAMLHRIVSGDPFGRALFALIEALRARPEPAAQRLRALLSRTAFEFPAAGAADVLDETRVSALVGDGFSVAELFNAAVAAVRGTASFTSSLRVVARAAANAPLLGLLTGQLSGVLRSSNDVMLDLEDEDDAAASSSPDPDPRGQVFVDFGMEFEDGPRTERWDDAEWRRRFPVPSRLDAGTAHVVQQGASDRPPQPNAHERFLGSMLAGAMGDALGYAIEFNDIEMIRRHHGPDGVTGPVLRDGLAHISDDTQMMLFTLEGLIRAHVARRIKPVDSDPVPEVQHAYQRWYHTQNQPWERAAGPYARHLAQPDGWLVTNRELFSPRAPGNTCMSALANFAQTHQHATPRHRINDSKGCGGVMRAAPVAVWSNDPAEVFKAAVDTAALTHSHPSGFLSAGVLAVVVHQLIRSVPLADSVRVARELLIRWPEHEEQLRSLDAAVDLGGRGPVSPEELKQTLGEGWVGEEALAIGLYAVLATGDLPSALLLSVNHSGDSDSTGIVCGNIAGAIYGNQAIPPEWLEKLELHDVIHTLARDALAEFSPGAPTDPAWSRRYPAW